jgi:altronate dehydratase small subunit
VASALRPLVAGERIRVGGPGGEVELALREDVPMCHKLAVRAVGAGGQVLKYGEAIGQATAPIRPGDHVHVHNLRSARGRSA